MPKVLVEYNLPDEQPEFDYAVNGRKYYNALYEINELLYRFDDTPKETIRRDLADIIANSGFTNE